MSLEDGSPLTDLAPIINRNKSINSSSILAFSSKSLLSSSDSMPSTSQENVRVQTAHYLLKL